METPGRLPENCTIRVEAPGYMAREVPASEVCPRGAATCAARRSPPAVYCWGENGGNYSWLIDGSSANLPVATPIPLPTM